MPATSIHRVIEEHAAARGGGVAITDGAKTLTYRSLNLSANVVARRLMASGLRRGRHAWVRMPCGADLACVLLAVLKAGGSYTWLADAGGPEGPSRRLQEGFPEGVSIEVGVDGDEVQYRHVGSGTLVAGADVPASPNLPVLTRGGDIACVLRNEEGNPLVLVPHEALTTLRLPEAVTGHTAIWTGEPGALDLWLALMSGTTAAVEPGIARPAAA